MFGGLVGFRVVGTVGTVIRVGIMITGLVVEVLSVDSVDG